MKKFINARNIFFFLVALNILLLTCKTGPHVLERVQVYAWKNVDPFWLSFHALQDKHAKIALDEMLAEHRKKNPATDAGKPYYKTGA